MGESSLADAETTAYPEEDDASFFFFAMAHRADKDLFSSLLVNRVPGFCFVFFFFWQNHPPPPSNERRDVDVLALCSTHGDDFSSVFAIRTFDSIRAGWRGSRNDPPSASPSSPSAGRGSFFKGIMGEGCLVRLAGLPPSPHVLTIPAVFFLARWRKKKKKNSPNKIHPGCSISSRSCMWVEKSNNDNED